MRKDGLQRVGCFMGPKTFLGWGYNLGMHIRPKGVGKNLGMPDEYREKIANPKIALDDGKVIWGCECWWGPEKDIQARIDALGDNVKNVTVEKMRETLYSHVPEDERPEMETVEWED